MKIDYVSDIACPWCAVGLHSLELAIKNLKGVVDVELRFHPYELNPGMALEGTDSGEYLRAKYGMSKEQLESNRDNLRARGAAVGFHFGAMKQVWNTFDGHRLLHWAGIQSAELQRKLKHALLDAYHNAGNNPADSAVLLELAEKVGLNVVEAAEVISSGRYGDEVRAEEAYWQQAGIQSVPSIIINERHLITGGQPPEVFEKILREIEAKDIEERGHA